MTKMLRLALPWTYLSATCLLWGQPQPQFVGSTACKTCHAAVYERWSKTRMANVVRDPKIHPDAILPDLSKPDPLVKFTRDDIAFVYGSKWKQRYFTKRGDDYYPLGAQWDVTHRIWRPYMVAPNTDWWVATLSRRQYAAPDRASLRWLPLRQLRHPNQNCDGMECGLREVPRTRLRACAPPVATQHRQSRPARYSAGDECLYPMPLARAAAVQSRSTGNTTIGRLGSKSEWI